MKFIKVVFVLFLLVPCHAYADMGSCYCFHSTVTTHNDQSYKGYFSIAGYDLSIDKDNAGYYYFTKYGNMRLRVKEEEKGALLKVAETDYHFFRYVQGVLYDTIALYEGLFIPNPFGDERDNTKVLLRTGGLSKILKKDIKDFTIHSVRRCPVGTSVETDIDDTDRQWLINKIDRIEDAGGVTLCGYVAVCYSPKTDAVTICIKALKELYHTSEFNDGKYSGYSYAEHVNKINKLIKQKIEELRTLKVLVVSACSC